MRRLCNVQSCGVIGLVFSTFVSSVRLRVAVFAKKRRGNVSEPHPRYAIQMRVEIPKGKSDMQRNFFAVHIPMDAANANGFRFELHTQSEKKPLHWRVLARGWERADGPLPKSSLMLIWNPLFRVCRLRSPWNPFTGDRTIFVPDEIASDAQCSSWITSFWHW